MSDTKDQIINSMCLTWRHDFGLDKRHDAFGYSGMTPDERDALRRRMAQLFDHHIAPLIAENERLQAAQVMPGFLANPIIDQLRAEVDGLRTLLTEAAEDIADWGAYASEYFQQKHDLAGCVARYREALGKGGRKDG